MFVCSADLRFSHSVWLSGAKRGTIGMDVLNDEIRVAYLDPADASEAINMAQLEWVPCMKLNLQRPSQTETICGCYR